MRILIAEDDPAFSHLLEEILAKCGVATSGRAIKRDGHSLVRAADAALYKAKENGRNRVEIAPYDGMMA